MRVKKTSKKLPLVLILAAALCVYAAAAFAAQGGSEGYERLAKGLSRSIADGRAVKGRITAVVNGGGTYALRFDRPLRGAGPDAFDREIMFAGAAAVEGIFDAALGLHKSRFVTRPAGDGAGGADGASGVGGSGGADGGMDESADGAGSAGAGAGAGGSGDADGDSLITLSL
ncbi:MAG: hypothetical protein LBU58_02995, partial [Clostridiales bacterium]|nr:hypothetical protein [Clostridiales bacterium]